MVGLRREVTFPIHEPRDAGSGETENLRERARSYERKGEGGNFGVRRGGTHLEKTNCKEISTRLQAVKLEQIVETRDCCNVM